MPPKKGKGKPPAHKLCAPLDPGFILKDLKKKEWKIGKSIGSGGFGLIYLADDASKPSVKDDAKYVIKVEPMANGPLFCELAFYQRAAKSEDIEKWRKSMKLQFVGIPPYIAHGLHNNTNGNREDGMRFLVMPRCGTDLHNLWIKSGKKFTRATVSKIAILIIDALEYMHSMEYVHADIKGANILQCYKDPKHVYLVDFGLAARYKSDGVHKEYKPDPRKAHNGTIEYTSVDAHKGTAPSRRADFEILGFVLVHWLSGKLPWETKLSDPLKVMEMKVSAMADVKKFVKTCCSTDTPDEVTKYLSCVAELEYSETPDYNKLRNFFKSYLKFACVSVSSPIEFGVEETARRTSPRKKQPVKAKSRNSRPLSSKTNTPSSSTPHTIEESQSSEDEQPPKKGRISARKKKIIVQSESSSASSEESDDYQPSVKRHKVLNKRGVGVAAQAKKKRNVRLSETSGSDIIESCDSDFDSPVKPVKLETKAKSSAKSGSKAKKSSKTQPPHMVMEPVNKVKSKELSRTRSSTNSPSDEEEGTSIIVDSSPTEETNKIIPGLNQNNRPPMGSSKNLSKSNPKKSDFAQVKTLADIPAPSTKDATASSDPSNDENKANSIIPGLETELSPLKQGLRQTTKLKSRYSMAPLHTVPVLTKDDALTGTRVGKHPVFKRKRKGNVPKSDSSTQTTPSLKKIKSRK
uniref:serine/threonine-protein kinase VRK1 n=1 Tax=Ciona intestinalis TaxID=7719 RepID=UPI000180D2C7|nr:serine/threonine-protein kinase VRK1 [Ciona intestinalis]|eukprot:XP_002131080.1 serine/threonine-protein kinase VRK1 [Ciona intestinalis]